MARRREGAQIGYHRLSRFRPLAHLDPTHCRDAARDHRRSRHRPGAARGDVDHRGDPPPPRRRVGRDGRRVGRRAGHRPRPRVPHDPPGARSPSARSARRSACPTARRQPRPRGGGGMGARRAGRRAAARRAARARGHGVHGDRRPLALVRARRRRAQGPRGRPDHRRARADARSRRTPRSSRHPGDPELLRLRDWLSTFLVFVRLFDRAVGPRLAPRAHGAGARAAPAGRGPRRHDPAARQAARRPPGR